jgi:stage III sporulation protein SpoIIIAA
MVELQSNEKLKLGRMRITDDLGQLMDILPPHVEKLIAKHPEKDRLIEVVMDLGRFPEARFPQGAEYLSDHPIERQDIQYCVDRVGAFSGDNRAGIERTLHRISGMRNRQGEIIGLTCRVGRAVYGTIDMVRDLVETGKSILMLGRPGVGKTTALREIARVLADDLHKRVVIIDSSNEIAGDGDIPHPAIGRARRMQVSRPELQHQVMIEAVENHMPEVIVIDEIGTELEAIAARTIAERGVQLVGTAHGNQLENLIKNPTLSDLIGGIQSVTLGDDEARRRATQKTVLERKAPPTFEIAIEMHERHRWVVHESVAELVDRLLRGSPVGVQVRTVDDEGKVTISEEAPPPPTLLAVKPDVPSGNRSSKGWRASGRTIVPPPPTSSAFSSLDGGIKTTAPETSHQNFDRYLADPSWNGEGAESLKMGANGEELPLHVYPYGIPRQQLEQVVEVLQLPIVFVRDTNDADAILALRSHIKNHAKLRQMGKIRQVPIYSVKAGTVPQIARTLRRMLNMDEPSTIDAQELQLFAKDGDDNELEALEEARLAVEQIVIPKGQPVELLPRSAKVRKMQHELVEHYRLRSDSFGEEPHRRIRIYPA